MTTEALILAPQDAVVEGEPVAVEHVGELLPSSILADPYVGVSALPFDERAQITLAKYQNVPDDWIDIRPEGLIYLSHMKARRVLNEAFGFGGWAIVPIGNFRREEKGNHVILYRTYRLYVNGRFSGEVEAAGDYWTNNSAQNYADAAESCQSYALNRLAKNFGIASQCWDKTYAEAWKKKYAVKSDGKWSKKGGAAVADEHKTETITPDVRASEVKPAPSPETPATAQTARIRLKSCGTSKVNSYTKKPQAPATDTDGNIWNFQGPGNIAVAQAAAESGSEIEVTFRVKEYKGTTYRNVDAATWAVD